MDDEWWKFVNEEVNDDEEMLEEDNTATVEFRYDEIQKEATFLYIAALASTWYHAVLGVPLPQTLVPKPCNVNHFDWPKRLSRHFNLGEEL